MNTPEKELIKEAEKLAQRHTEYAGCCPSTFLGVADALKLEGRKEAYKATIGLSGGIADMGVGACGAMAGAAMAIGLRYNLTPEKVETDTTRRGIHKVRDSVERVAKKFIDEYGSYTCRDIQMKLYGKSFDLKKPEIKEEFKKIGWPGKCSEHVVAKAAAWTVEEILNIEKAHVIEK